MALDYICLARARDTLKPAYSVPSCHMTLLAISQPARERVTSLYELPL